MADYSDEQIRAAIQQLQMEEAQAKRMNGAEDSRYILRPYDEEINFRDIPMSNLQVQGSGGKNQEGTFLGARAGYQHPIDDSSAIEGGISGHYAKGKKFKDTGVDRVDARYKKRFDNDSQLRAEIGANINGKIGKRGLTDANVEYEIPFKKGGKVKSKPKVSKASSRGDGCAQRGKTRGKFR